MKNKNDKCSSIVQTILTNGTQTKFDEMFSSFLSHLPENVCSKLRQTNYMNANLILNYKMFNEKSRNAIGIFKQIFPFFFSFRIVQHLSRSK